MSAKKNITVDYVTDLHARIERGETPLKIDELPRKEFIRQMLPHVQKFLAQNYTYKEIAVFLGHISAGDLRKAVAKDNPASSAKKKPQTGPLETTRSTQISAKKRKGSKAPLPRA